MERDNIKKEEKINGVEENSRKIDKKIDDLNRVIYRQEQFSHRNCILLHDVKKNENENTNTVVTETLNELLQGKLTYIEGIG